MPQYSVTHSCGHTRTHNLFGPTKDRESRIEWLETVSCDECRYNAMAEEAAKQAEELGLPELKGTPKQVKWALTIRKKAISVQQDDRQRSPQNIREFAQAAVDSYDGLLTEEQALEILNHVEMVRQDTAARIRMEESAEWWIDNRDEGAKFFTGEEASREAMESHPEWLALQERMK